MSTLFLHAEAKKSAAERKPADVFFDSIRSLDLARCRTVEFCVALLEHEDNGKVSHITASWPATVEAMIRRESARFRREHPDMVVRCITTACAKRLGKTCCILILHYSSKTEHDRDLAADGLAGETERA